MKWSIQGKALVGELRFADGAKAKALVMGPRSRAKALQVLCPKAGAQGDYEASSFDDALASLDPGTAIDVLCMQERVFGESALEAPEGLTPKS